MKICWDNIENIRLTRNGNFRDIVKKITYYLKICKVCGEEFLGAKNVKSCSLSCAGKIKRHSEETKKRLTILNSGKNHPFYGKHHSEETKQKIGKGNKNKIITENMKKRISIKLKSIWKDTTSR